MPIIYIYILCKNLDRKYENIIQKHTYPNNFHVKTIQYDLESTK